MTAPTTSVIDVRSDPGPSIVVVGWLMALWSVGFAAVNVFFEATNHFADGPYAAYASGISIVNWLVVGLKVLGAAVALLSVAKTSRYLAPNLLAILLWGAFATLGVYTLGSVVQAVGLVFGITGLTDTADLGPTDIAYVLLFLAAATGYGILAISHARRYRVPKGYLVLGVLGAPVLLGLILLVAPALLSAIGLMPAA